MPDGSVTVIEDDAAPDDVVNNPTLAMAATTPMTYL